jgi:hypothetical protein
MSDTKVNYGQEELSSPKHTQKPQVPQLLDSVPPYWIRDIVNGVVDSLKALEQRIIDRVMKGLVEQIQLKEINLNSAAPRLLDMNAAAAYMGRTKRAFVNLVHKGDIPTVRKGNEDRVLFDRVELDKLIERWKQEQPLHIK